MCGIVGVFVARAGKLDVPFTAERMQVHLRHRGPDDAGIFASENGHCALAHTRLSILDLSTAGHQPMGWGDLGAGSREQGAWSKEHGAGSREHGAGWERE